VVGGFFSRTDRRKFERYFLYIAVGSGRKSRELYYRNRPSCCCHLLYSTTTSTYSFTSPQSPGKIITIRIETRYLRDLSRPRITVVSSSHAPQPPQPQASRICITLRVCVCVCLSHRARRN